MDFGGVNGIAQLDTLFGFPVPLTTCKGKLIIIFYLFHFNFIYDFVDYASLIASLKTIGYIPGQTLFGAPYGM